MIDHAPIREALARGDFNAAALAARALIERDPDDSEGYFLLGMVASDARQIGKAIPLVEQAIARREDPRYVAQLARLLSLARRDGPAGEAAERALALRPRDALTLDTIGCVLARLGRHAETLAPFSAAVAAEPDNLEFRYNLAAANGFTGRVDEARAHYETILAADPLDARSHYALAILSRQTPAANHVERLKSVLSRANDKSDPVRIRYALAKELEDLGDYSEAYHYLAAANANHKRALDYDFTQDEAIFDAIEQVFTASPPPLAGAGSNEGSPIFIVGMPRTGTTLVDRILSSHPDVISAGELQAMPIAVKRLSGTKSRLVIDAETIRASATLDPLAIAKAYMAQADHYRLAESARFIDKLPANFLYVDHIARAFPNASIVCLRRAPMDTVWSNFKNLFASQSAYYAYSYDLMDTARYYQRFDQLMGLWETLFPSRVLQLSYEALVADQEGQSRRLLSHCGLAWDDACLSFYENTAPVATPSAAQVRRPINADAVARWKRYEEWLGPVADWLERQGIRTN